MDTKPPARAPIVERVAGWSARHRKTAVFGWLLLVVVAVAVGHQEGNPTPLRAARTMVPRGAIAEP